MVLYIYLAGAWIVFMLVTFFGAASEESELDILNIATLAGILWPIVIPIGVLAIAPWYFVFWLGRKWSRRK